MIVLEKIKFPLVKVLQYLPNLIIFENLLCYLNDRQNSFIFLFLTIGVFSIIIFSVYFFEKIIKVSFKPL